MPVFLWSLFMTTAASLQTRRTYNRPGHFSTIHGFLRMARLIPYLFITAGMLPHQVCSFLEGLSVQGGEFEKTPKSGGKPGKHGEVRIHWYVCVELAYFLYQVAWCCWFVSLWWAHGSDFWFP